MQAVISKDYYQHNCCNVRIVDSSMNIDDSVVSKYQKQLLNFLLLTKSSICVSRISGIYGRINDYFQKLHKNNKYKYMDGAGNDIFDKEWKTLTTFIEISDLSGTM